MELQAAHVRTLQEIVRWGSFSRAAEALHLSQPAVSHHVRHLEEVAGLRLLERAGKRALPTPAGQLLLAHAARAFGELEAARQALQGLRGKVSGQVRLGTGATASIYLLPPLLGRLRARYPELELVVVTGTAGEITSAVLRSELDLGVVTLPVPMRALAVTPFFVDRLVAIAAPGTGWPRRRPRGPADLARDPLILYERGGTIRRVIDEWFRRGGASPRIAMELDNAEAIKRLVGAGLGVSLGSWVAVRAEARAGTLVTAPLSPPLHRTLAIVRRRHRASSPALATVLGALEAFGRRG